MKYFDKPNSKWPKRCRLFCGWTLKSKTEQELQALVKGHLAICRRCYGQRLPSVEE